ncbi:MAG: hypothetical protein WA208_07210 [Thermoanaerobaculia bacterium]
MTTPPLHLSIGGITFALTPVDERLTLRIEGPLRHFRSEPVDAEVQLNVRALERALPVEGELLFDSGAVWRLFQRPDGFRIDCTSELFGPEPYKVATFDPTFTRGEVAIRTDALGREVDPLDYPLDEVLVSNLLGRGRGVELHSCGVIDREGRGHLFVGVSGAGKTTTARIWGDDALVVSDDRVIVRSVNQEFRMYGTPWHGEARLCSPESAPLAGVYLLRQAPETRLRSLDAAEAVARLFSCTFPLFHDATALTFTLGILADLVRSVPVRELQFTPDRTVLDAIASGV